MSKKKVQYIRNTQNIIETKYYYPIYFYLQDEDCMDELIKVDSNGTAVIIKHNHFGFTIEKTTNFYIQEYHLNNITDEKHFNKELKDSLKRIKKLKL
jgi:hypothetical protein